MEKLPRDFYLRDGLSLARALLGKVFATNIDGVLTSGVISETEAYMGVIDKASHAYGGLRSARTETMYLEGGRAYVYLIYGMYNCMNVVANAEDVPEAVLIRGIVPLDGVSHMAKRRAEFRKKTEVVSPRSNKELLNLTNGPGKLCVSLGIDRSFDKKALWGDDIYVADSGFVIENEPMLSKRVNIDYAEEAADYLWRFSLSDDDIIKICKCGGER